MDIPNQYKVSSIFETSSYVVNTGALTSPPGGQFFISTKAFAAYHVASARASLLVQVISCSLSLVAGCLLHSSRGCLWYSAHLPSQPADNGFSVHIWLSFSLDKLLLASALLGKDPETEFEAGPIELIF